MKRTFCAVLLALIAFAVIQHYAPRLDVVMRRRLPAWRLRLGAMLASDREVQRWFAEARER